MLCRVFHRSKAENSNELNHHHYHLHDHQSSMQFHNPATNQSPPISTIPHVFYNNNSNNPNPVSSGFDNNPTPQTSLLHLLHCNNSQDLINAKMDDVCGFFWDPNIEDMEFDGDSTMMFQWLIDMSVNYIHLRVGRWVESFVVCDGWVKLCITCNRISLCMKDSEAVECFFFLILFFMVCTYFPCKLWFISQSNPLYWLL